MEKQPALGLNRTGVALSPFDVEKMLEDNADLAPPIDTAEAAAASAIRERYIIESTNVGSVPIPASLRGVWESGKTLLTGEHPQVLVDKMGERLAFERSAVRLYQGLLTKCDALPDALPADTLAQLKRFCEEETRHFQLLANAMRALGADPTAQTPGADIACVESSGLGQVIGDPRTSVLHSLHAILAAELIDQVGWEDLIALAEQQGHDQLVPQLRQALQREGEHLAALRRLVTALTLDEARATP